MGRRRENREGEKISVPDPVPGPNDRGLAKRWVVGRGGTEVFIFAAERTLARRRSRTLQWPNAWLAMAMALF
jgi:hypothetical protein